jgi:hypothetical protein
LQQILNKKEEGMGKLIKGIIIIIMSFIFAQNILFPLETKAWEITLVGRWGVTSNGVPVCACPRLNPNCLCIIDIF